MLPDHLSPTWLGNRYGNAATQALIQWYSAIKVVRASSYRAPWRRGADRGRGRVPQGSRLGTCYTDDYGSVPGYHEAEQHGKLTTCEAELQQPDAQRSLGDGRAQGMMHVVTQHMPHAVRA